MDLYLIASTPNKGLGVFAARPIRKDKLIFHIDLRSRPQYSLRDLAALSAWDDFFAMPEDWQRRHYVHLAPSIKRKYCDRLCALI